MASLSLRFDAGLIGRPFNAVAERGRVHGALGTLTSAVPLVSEITNTFTLLFFLNYFLLKKLRLAGPLDVRRLHIRLKIQLSVLCHWFSMELYVEKSFTYAD